MLVHRTSYSVYNHGFRSKFSLIFLLQKSSFSTQLVSKRYPRNRKASDFLIYCNSQITKHGRNGNVKEAESVFNRMSQRNTISWTAMLTAFAENGNIINARNMFDEMPERTTASYNAMITAYIKNEFGVNEAHRLFCQIPEKNSVSYSVMITGFVQVGMFDKAEELYAEMPVKWRDPVSSNALMSGYLKVGRLKEAFRIFENMVEKNVVSWSSMIDGYCKMGNVADARGLFDRMQERNVVTWTAMIDGYFKVGSFQAGFGLFLSMISEGNVKVNSTTLTVMFDACGTFHRYQEGIQIHGLVCRLGFEFDVFLGNSMIRAYCRFGFTGAAEVVFDMMSKKDIITWNSLLAGHVQCDEIVEAYEIFKRMPRKDVVSWTTMITGFSGNSEMDKCVELFRMMPDKDDIAWTAVISGFVNNGEYEEAVHWFVEMVREEITPNPLTFSSVLSASAGLAALNTGLLIHARVVKIDMEYDLSIQNSLVSMYSKCGNVHDAYRIFTSMDAPNVVSYNSMITGFSQNGFGKAAINLFTKMENEGKEPTDVTFLGVLSACVHMGLVEIGLNYFNSMKSLYGVQPQADHCACMVDLLGRNGLLDEAFNLISSMPFEFHSGVWGALLAASKIHLRIDLAELAAKKLMEHEPDSATPYVVLSQLYSVAGKKRDGERVRNIKKSRGIRKAPGCSWIIVNDTVHPFLVGNQSHLELEEIKSILQIIEKEMESYFQRFGLQTV